MRKMVFQELLFKHRSTRNASNLSGYARSSHYYKPKERIVKKRIDLEMLEAIENAVLTNPSYGIRRVTALLRMNGMHVNRKKVYKLMKVANLIRTRKARKYMARRTVTIPEKPNRVWEQDITYVWCGKDGWCYLFNIIDCYTREWIAYTFSVECGTDEAIDTLEKAIMDRFLDGIVPDLTIRNDGGFQYTSHRFIRILQTYGINHEVTGKNRPDEDAYIEAFYRWLKEDYIWQHEFQTFQDADELMKDFFRHYNYSRPHSSLRYMTPKQFYLKESKGGSG
jgi:putative transposase